MLLLLAQVDIPASGDNAWMWVAGIMATALAAMFVRSEIATNKRVERCEEREDELLKDNRSSTSALKDQVTATLKAAEVAGQAVEYAKRSDTKTDELRRQVDELKSDVRRALEELRISKR